MALDKFSNASVDGLDEKQRDSRVASAWALQLQETECDSCELNEIIYWRITGAA